MMWMISPLVGGGVIYVWIQFLPGIIVLEVPKEIQLAKKVIKKFKIFIIFLYYTCYGYESMMANNEKILNLGGLNYWTIT